MSIRFLMSKSFKGGAMSKLSLLGVVLAMLLAPSIASAQWVFLGQRGVSFRGDRDVIPVTAVQGVFGRLQLRVQGNGVHIHRVRVNFANGTAQVVQVNQWVPPNSATRVLDLPGAHRVIRNVQLFYSTRGRPWRGQAVVRLFGSRIPGVHAPPPVTVAPPPQPMVPSVPPPVRVAPVQPGYPVGPTVPPPVRVAPASPPVVVTPAQPTGPWIPLGDRVVNFGADHDVIPVTAANGRFRRLRLAVAHTPVFLHRVVVVFGNGQQFNIPVNRVIQPGTTTRAVDLPGGARIVRNVQFFYRSQPRFRGRAVVRLMGRH